MTTLEHLKRFHNRIKTDLKEIEDEVRRTGDKRLMEALDIKPRETQKTPIASEDSK